MSLFNLFRKKPTTVLDVLNKIPEYQQQKKLYEAMSLMCEDGG
jgi:predicted GTPase